MHIIWLQVIDYDEKPCDALVYINDKFIWAEM